MRALEKLKDALADRVAEAVSASVTVVLAWMAYQIAPAILPAIEDAISKRVLLALLATLVVLNILFLVVIWHLSGSGDLRLKYGVYWDRHKNPHCPSCRKPLGRYGDYSYSGTGYYCKPCRQVCSLTDSQGNMVEPAQVVSEL